MFILILARYRKPNRFGVKLILSPEDLFSDFCERLQKSQRKLNQYRAGLHATSSDEDLTEVQNLVSSESELQNLVSESDERVVETTTGTLENPMPPLDDVMPPLNASPINIEDDQGDANYEDVLEANDEDDTPMDSSDASASLTELGITNRPNVLISQDYPDLNQVLHKTKPNSSSPVKKTKTKPVKKTGKQSVQFVVSVPETVPDSGPSSRSSTNIKNRLQAVNLINEKKRKVAAKSSFVSKRTNLSQEICQSSDEESDRSESHDDEAREVLNSDDLSSLGEPDEPIFEK